MSDLKGTMLGRLKASTGAGLVGVKKNPQSQKRDVATKLNDKATSFDYIPPQYHNAIAGHISTADMTVFLNEIFSSEDDIEIIAGLYNTTAPIVVPNGTEGKKITGQGIRRTVIKNQDITGKDCIVLQGLGSTLGNRVAGVDLSNMTILGNPLSGNGLFTNLAYENRFERLIFDGNGLDGCLIEKGFYSNLVQCEYRKNGKSGLKLGKTANGNSVYGGHFGGGGGNSNGEYGLIITSDADPDRTHGNQIYGGVFESNTLNNILIRESDANYICGQYIETGINANAQIKITDPGAMGVKSRGNVITGVDFFGAATSVEVDFAEGTLITENSINFGLNITPNSTRTMIINNTRLEGVVSDIGLDTIMLQDPAQTARYYRKSGNNKRLEMLFGGALTRLNYGGNFPVDFQINGVDTMRLSNDGSIKHFFTAWNKPFWLGAHALWIDSGSRLRLKLGAPISDIDGVVVGSQI